MKVQLIKNNKFSCSKVHLENTFLRYECMESICLLLIYIYMELVKN